MCVSSMTIDSSGSGAKRMRFKDCHCQLLDRRGLDLDFGFSVYRT